MKQKKIKDEKNGTIFELPYVGTRVSSCQQKCEQTGMNIKNLRIVYT